MKQKRICILGLGYIGLPTAAFLASKKTSVLGVDIDKGKIKELKSLNYTSNEKGLEIIVKDTIRKGYLTIKDMPEKSDVFIITVPTPFKNQKKSKFPSPDISYIKKSIFSISDVLEKDNLIILESTSPVGTTDKIVTWLSKLRPDLSFPKASNKSSKKPDVFVSYCPERVLPGNILKELENNDRIIGGQTKFCSNKAYNFYKGFVSGNLFQTDSKSAEMSKLAENAYRDLNIAYANEISMICDDLKINPYNLIHLSNKHPRVNILNPGPGVGGHCIAVDPWFIVSNNPKKSQLIQAARRVNEKKKDWVIKKIANQASKIKKKKISISFYGITYKPNSDDFRESPALEIVRNFSKKSNIECLIVEPNLKKLPNEISGCLKTNLNESKKSDIHVLLVSHKEFEKKLPKKGLIVDMQGIWSK
ncbi:MAG: UDP-N-acetyl-D-mannosamine dehydrogenase [Gammaproteobacteria bacterium]|nr:UDP-N-acetyl-D-mannosamine dehydrogenase [Gammaproteobacteria bacterium]